MSICLTSKGGGLPLHSSQGGDFENTKIASYFHHLGWFMMLTMFMKTSFIINQPVFER